MLMKEPHESHAQLNVNVANLPDPLTDIWEQPDSQQQRLVIETLARLPTKVSPSDKSDD